MYTIILAFRNETLSTSQRVLKIRINDLPGQEEESLRGKLEAALSKYARVIQIDFQYYGNTGWLQDYCYAILEPNPETMEPLENLLPRQLSIDEDKISHPATYNKPSE
ncbi:uncharacterized protein VTP21DRAFT_9039 [Calcarisporiella thermophila]|uniref:uncharacterized protein n=1 Tax=Calcarisporiella thermophila TaxID=911321 RepID=UPI0037448966